MEATKAMVEDLIKRTSCPVCESYGELPIFAVPPSVFCENNTTIDQQKLESSGLLKLPSIDLIQCENCQTVYTAHLLSPSWSDTFWKEVYQPEKSLIKIY